ncbi:LacI family DNA-binding transcriptional regulator [Tindallia californiensis]|uniref:Transcriptional regulator, LacI family n=1 Tax=Tindallia californiensis TaxID=159292 RepID=A0A1H3R6T6_9FIRM|nr:LacI family DNA-binding transcriptional regulator [Tindallia californiensis]SDZ20689.1 transcriptional regulator, LacI family [Tindallia californiensis]
MANIKEVAKKAGVSVATISRVLNHPETVAPARKAHVEKIMKEMNYKPNAFARGLNLNRSRTIGLLIPGLTNPLYPEIAEGVEKVAREKGYSVFLCNTEGSLEKETEHVSLLMEKRVDGLILVASELSDKKLLKMKQDKIQMVHLGRNRSGLGIPTVYTDYKMGGYIATKHLLDIGYRRIAMIQGKKDHPVDDEKIEGYKNALKEYGVTPNLDLILIGGEDITGGSIATNKLLSKEEMPQAIFAGNDLMAIGAMEALKRKGISIPHKVAVMGFDDIKPTAYVEPKLTTVSQPVHKMGLMAARLLFENLQDGRKTEEAQPEIYLQPKLKIRRSCGQDDRLQEIFN